MRKLLLILGIGIGFFFIFFNIQASDLTTPNTFTSGTPIVAADVNANFTAVESAVVDNNTDIATNVAGISTNVTDISTNASDLLSVVTALDSAYRYTAMYFTSVPYSTTYDSFASDVLTATCPTGMLMTGGGVFCGTSSTSYTLTNFGVINGSVPEGNSMIGMCAADALVHSSTKNGPGITVTAVCLSPAIVPPQLSVDGLHSLGQGAPSSGALLVIQHLKSVAEAHQTAAGE